MTLEIILQNVAKLRPDVVCLKSKAFYFGIQIQKNHQP